jgi:hypothetical protein
VIATCLVTFAACVTPEGKDTLPELTITRDLRIDADSANLSPIGWLAVLSDGAIAIAQRQDGAVLYFSADGTRLGAFGRSGDGPGEFRHVGAYGLLGDTLWVGDPTAARTTLIAPDRSLAGTSRWPSSLTFDPPLAGPSPTFFWIRPVAVLADSVILTEPMLAAGSESLVWPGGTHPGDPIVLVRSDGTFERVVAWIPEDKCVARIVFEGGSGSTDIPLCAKPQRAIAADGSRIAFAIPGDETEGGRYRLVMVGARGDTILSRQYSHTLEPIPRHLIDSVIARRLETAKQPEWRDAYRSMKLPTAFPPFARLLVGRDETIWLESYTRAGDRAWQVLDARGDLIGRVTLPRAVHLHVAEASALWGIETDSDGLEHVVRYRVSR